MGLAVKHREIASNLILLCSRYTLWCTPTASSWFSTRSTHPGLAVTTKAGVDVPHRPVPPWRPTAELDPRAGIGAGTLPPTTYDRLDLHYTVVVLLQHAA